MSLSTKDVNVGGSSTSKTLTPGERTARVTKITLEDFKFKEGHKFLVYHLEGPDLGASFDGFSTDKNDPQAPKYKGQIGRVRSSEYAYNDGTTKTGIVINRDQEIMKAIKSLCIAMRIETWFDAQDLKYDTIPDFIDAMNEEMPYHDIWMSWCINGVEYINKSGYTNYDMFLPKFVKGKTPYELVDTQPSRLIKFDPATHIKVKKQDNKSVTEFSGDAPAPAANTDLEL